MSALAADAGWDWTSSAACCHLSGGGRRKAAARDEGRQLHTQAGSTASAFETRSVRSLRCYMQCRYTSSNAMHTVSISIHYPYGIALSHVQHPLRHCATRQLHRSLGCQPTSSMQLAAPSRRAALSERHTHSLSLTTRARRLDPHHPTSASCCCRTAGHAAVRRWLCWPGAQEASYGPAGRHRTIQRQIPTPRGTPVLGRSSCPQEAVVYEIVEHVGVAHEARRVAHDDGRVRVEVARVDVHLVP